MSDDSQYDKDNSSVDSFGVAVAISVAIFMVIMLIFILVRSWKCSPRIFNLRRYFSPRVKGYKHVNNVLPYRKVPTYKPVKRKYLTNQRFPWGSISWLWPVVWEYNDRRLYRTHGADALMYNVFMRNCFFLACSFALPAIVIILPVNTQGGNNELDKDDSNYVEGMGIITMGNVDSNGNLIAVHILFTWIFSLLAYLFVFVTYKQFMWIRRKWMKTNCARAYTIMLEELPHKLRKDRRLLAFAKKTFPGEVMAAHVAYDTKLVRDYMDKRRSYIKAYENASMLHEKKKVGGFICWPRCCPGGEYGAEDPTTKDGCHGWCIGLCGDKVDAKELFERKIKKYEKRIAKVQKRPARHLTPTGVGFITFSSTFISHSKFWFDVGRFVKKRPVNDTITLAMSVRPAPEPTDVKWSALTVMRISFIIRSLIVTFLMIAMIFLWTFPALAVAFITNLEAVSEINGFGWLSFVEDLPGFIKGLIQGFLPPIGMAILNAIIYPLIKLAHWKIQGAHQKSDAMWLVMRVYWLYLVVNVVLVITIGGAIFQVLQQVIDDPISIFDLLARSLPQQSLFFMLFILVSGVSRKPLALFRIGFAFKWVICIFMAKNKKRRNQAQIPGGVDFAKATAYDLLIFTILMVYCVLSPLVSVFACMYYGIVYVTSRHNLLYTHINRWESGANMWRAAYHMIMAGILLFQLTMLGIFAVGTSTATPALAPPIVFTVLLWLIMHWSWSDSSYFGNVSDCAREGFKYKPEFSRAYVDPALRPEYMCPYNFDAEVPSNETPLGLHGSQEPIGTDLEMQQLVRSKDNDQASDVEDDPRPDGEGIIDTSSSDTDTDVDDTTTETDSSSDSDIDNVSPRSPRSPRTDGSTPASPRTKKKRNRNKDFADRAGKILDFVGEFD